MFNRVHHIEIEKGFLAPARLQSEDLKKVRSTYKPSGQNWSHELPIWAKATLETSPCAFSYFHSIIRFLFTFAHLPPYLFKQSVSSCSFIYFAKYLMSNQHLSSLLTHRTFSCFGWKYTHMSYLTSDQC